MNRCEFCTAYNPRSDHQLCDEWAKGDSIEQFKRENYCAEALKTMLQYEQTKAVNQNTATINKNINKEYTRKY